METRTETIYICHKGVNNCNYFDPNHVHYNVTTLEAMALLIARLAGTLQAADDKQEDCEYQIDINKIK